MDKPQEPQTEAGKRWLANRERYELWHHIDGRRDETLAAILDIERQSRAAYRADLAERVRGLPSDRGDETWSTVERAAVLKLIEAPEEAS